MKRKGGIVHHETTEQRLMIIERLIREARDEIERLEAEAEALRNGAISLRSLGLDRIVLYPLWRQGLLTVKDVQLWIAEHGCLRRGINGLGPIGEAAVMDAIAAYR